MEDHQNPENYIAYVFYYNRNDPRVFVPRRIGLGHTLNFARPASYLIVFTPVVVGLAVLTCVLVGLALR